MTSRKPPEGDKRHGGPGSSHQRPDLPDPTQTRGQPDDEQRPRSKSRISGGGGEADKHHTHDPRLK